MTPGTLSKLYISNICWKCKVHFFHPWWTCGKARKYWDQACILIQKILKVNRQLKPQAFLWGLIDKQMESFYGTLLLYITTTSRLLYAQRWKDLQILTMKNGL